MIGKGERDYYILWILFLLLWGANIFSFFFFLYSWTHVLKMKVNLIPPNGILTNLSPHCKLKYVGPLPPKLKYISSTVPPPPRIWKGFQLVSPLHFFQENSNSLPLQYKIIFSYNHPSPIIKICLTPPFHNQNSSYPPTHIFKINCSPRPTIIERRVLNSWMLFQYICHLLTDLILAWTVSESSRLIRNGAMGAEAWIWPGSVVVATPLP